MTTIFEQIISVGNSENVLRSNPKTITESLAKSVKVEELKYIPYNLKDYIVLTGTKKKDTISNDDFKCAFNDLDVSNSDFLSNLGHEPNNATHYSFESTDKLP